MTSGTGSVVGASGSGTATITVNLTGVTDAQQITVTLLSVSNGATSTDVGVPMGVLMGDVNADGVVNSGDAVVTRNRSGQASDGTNFRFDVNLDGSINSGDATAVRNRSGQSIPQQGARAGEVATRDR